MMAPERPGPGPMLRRHTQLGPTREVRNHQCLPMTRFRHRAARRHRCTAHAPKVPGSECRREMTHRRRYAGFPEHAESARIRLGARIEEASTEGSRTQGRCHLRLLSGCLAPRSRTAPCCCSRGGPGRRRGRPARGHRQVPAQQGVPAARSAPASMLGQGSPWARGSTWPLPTRRGQELLPILAQPVKVRWKPARGSPRRPH
jgi:hypothetical protein